MKAIVVQLGRIGDLILLTPMFEVLKHQYNAELTLLVGPSNYSIIKGHPSVDKIIVADKSPLKLPGLFLKIVKHKFDVWLDPRDHYSREGRLLAKLGRADMKIGFNNDTKNPVFTHSVKNENRDLHQVQIGLNALKPLGYELTSQIPKPSLPLNPNSEVAISKFLGSTNTGFTLINISASNSSKMWHPELWSKFIMKKENSLNGLVLCYAPTHESIALKINSECGNSLRLFCSVEISDIVSLVRRSALLISPDTSLVHIAAAFNIPVLALYSGIDDFYIKFRPLSDVHKTIRADRGDTGIRSIVLESLLSGFDEIRSTIASPDNPINT